mmetsp:Transcript_70612/g.111710  ORF Transcript_70612/g.111710 Transcript_70612/m.111710 type:complete len:129 (+) Transcript_70612:70-456(+)
MEQMDMNLSQLLEEIDYSDKYCDDIYEYRRVTVPREMVPTLPTGRTMEEWEWRQNGIVMSRGWEHYDQHLPEAHVLLFRRVIGTDPRTGEIPLNMAVKVQQRKQYVQELEQSRQRMMQERQESMGMEY